MKIIIKFLMCIALIMVCITGCANNDEAFTQKSYIAEVDEVAKVNIDVNDRQIEIIASTDNQIHINYFENSKEYFDISVSDDNVLTMTSANDKQWTDYIGGKSATSSRKISLQLPTSLLTTLNLSTTNEDISLPSLTIADDLSISSYGGNIVFDKLNVGNSININAKNGNISGSIIGSYDDYTVTCDIKKGKSNLPSSKESGTKMLMASNNNGDIDIKFVSE